MNRAKPMVPRTGSQRRDTTVRISQKLVPKLPHERDESAATGKEPPTPVIEQAADDLKQGRQDTGRMPETNRLARRLASKN
jgi:hypothetical protein